MAKLPKPISSEAYVVAAFNLGDPRFLCREPQGRYWVTTGDFGRAMKFGGISLAHEALDAWLEFIGRGHQHIPADGDWRVWRVTSRTTFAEA